MTVPAIVRMNLLNYSIRMAVMHWEHYCKKFLVVDKRRRVSEARQREHAPSLGDYQMMGFVFVAKSFVTMAKEKGAAKEHGF